MIGCVEKSAPKLHMTNKICEKLKVDFHTAERNKNFIPASTKPPWYIITVFITFESPINPVYGFGYGCGNRSRYET